MFKSWYSQPNRNRDIIIIAFIWGLQNTFNSDTDVQNRLLDSVGEGEGGMFRKNSMYIIYSETSPAQVGCMRQVLGPGALGRPRRIGMGNTYNSMADSCQCMTRPTEMLWSN